MRWVLYKRGLITERPGKLIDHDAQEPGVLDRQGRDLVGFIPEDDALRPILSAVPGAEWDERTTIRIPANYESLRQVMELRKEGVLFTLGSYRLLEEVFQRKLKRATHPKSLKQAVFYPSNVAEVRIGTDRSLWACLSCVSELAYHKGERCYFGTVTRGLRNQLKQLGFEVPALPKTSPHLFQDTSGRWLVGGSRIKADRIPWRYPIHGAWDEDRLGWRIPIGGDDRAAVLWELSQRNVVIPAEFEAEASRGKEIAENPPPDPALLYEMSYAVDWDQIEIPGFAFPLKRHQHPAVTYVLATKRAFVADEMGLGKTIVSLAVAQKTQSFPCLVTAPASVCTKWVREVGKFIPHCTASTDITSGADVVVISHNKLWETFQSGALASVNWKCLIVDESHKFKGGQNKRTQALTGLVKVQPIPYRLCLTGTPVPNRPIEIEAQLEILGQLEDVFGGHWRFAEAFCVGETSVYGKKLYNGGTNLDLLNQKLRETCYIRRLKDEADPTIPPKSREFIDTSLTNHEEYSAFHERFRLSLKNGGVEKLRRGEGQVEWWERNPDEEEQGDKDNPLVLLGVLRRLVSAGKVARAAQEISRLIDQHGRLVVFCVHRNTLTELKSLFPDALTIRGGDGKRKQRAIDAFAKPDGPPLILVSLLAAESGIELVSACASLTVEFWWDPATMFQSEDRLARTGQTRNVTNYYLSAPGTIDDFMRRILSKKYRLTKAAIDGGKVRRLDLTEELERFYREALVA